MKASSFTALSLALALAPIASAVDSYTVDINRVGPNNPVAPGGTADISIVGHLSETTPGSNLGLAFFAFDLEWVPAAGPNLNLCTGLSLTANAAVANFNKANNLGYSVDFTGTCVAPDLVQLGGGQNTINNTGMAPFPPFPSGPVALGVGLGAGGVEMYTGTLTVPMGTAAGVYTLRIKANSLFANAITSQNGGNYVVDPVTAVIGASLPITVGCTATIPSVVHGASLPGQTIPCSGYIDPRRESSDGVNLNQGLTSARIKFNTNVLKSNGADIDGADFTVTETGGGAAPTVSSAAYVVPADKTYVQVNLSRPITLQQWTTIVANVFNECGQPIASSGNQGPGVNETDRIDIGFLPADVNQSSNVSPLDLIAFKQVVNASVLPPAGCSQLNTDYTDINRSGGQTPLDLIAFKQLINNLAPSTRSWQGKTILNPRP